MDKGGNAGRGTAGPASVTIADLATAFEKLSVDSALPGSDEAAIGMLTPDEGMFAESRVRDILEWKITCKTGLGFRNLGNTCFLNSVLQCLCYLPPLRQHLLLEGFPWERVGTGGVSSGINLLDKKKTPVLYGMTALMKEVHTTAAGVGPPSIRPDFFVDNLSRIGEQFKVGTQADAHEFLRVLLGRMVEECSIKHGGVKPSAPHHRAETTAMHRIFGGYVRSELKCSRCEYCSRKYDPCLDLTLEVPDEVTSVETALKHFSQVETLEEGNAWTCPICERPVKAEKQLTAFKPPNALVLQLKRTTYTLEGTAKIDKKVEYQEELELGVSGVEGPAQYDLTGVVVHQGDSFDEGHYFSYVRNSDCKWAKMNDTSVTPAELTEVLDQQAYLLFYTRRRATPPLVVSSPKAGPVSAAATTTASTPAASDSSADATIGKAPETSTADAAPPVTEVGATTRKRKRSDRDFYDDLEKAKPRKHLKRWHAPLELEVDRDNDTSLDDSGGLAVPMAATTGAASQSMTGKRGRGMEEKGQEDDDEEDEDEEDEDENDAEEAGGVEVGGGAGGEAPKVKKPKRQNAKGIGVGVAFVEEKATALVATAANATSTTATTSVGPESVAAEPSAAPHVQGGGVSLAGNAGVREEALAGRPPEREQEPPADGDVSGVGDDTAREVLDVAGGQR